MSGLVELAAWDGRSPEPHHPLNNEYNVLEDDTFALKIEIATCDALITGDLIEQAEARQLATQQVLTKAGFQDYQARAFQLGDNEPTRVVREFVQEYGWERGENNNARREAKEKLDKAILNYLNAVAKVDPIEAEVLKKQFVQDENVYRVHQSLDTVTKSGNFRLGLETLGVPPALTDHTSWNGDSKSQQKTIIKTLSRQLSPEDFPTKFGELSVKATEKYLNLVRVQLSDHQRRQMQRIIEIEFTPDIEEESDNKKEDYWLNGHRPPQPERRQRLEPTYEQRKLIGMLATS